VIMGLGSITHEGNSKWQPRAQSSQDDLSRNSQGAPRGASGFHARPWGRSLPRSVQPQRHMLAHQGQHVAAITFQCMALTPCSRSRARPPESPPPHPPALSLEASMYSSDRRFSYVTLLLPGPAHAQLQRSASTVCCHSNKHTIPVPPCLGRAEPGVFSLWANHSAAATLPYDGTQGSSAKRTALPRRAPQLASRGGFVWPLPLHQQRAHFCSTLPAPPPTAMRAQGQG